MTEEEMHRAQRALDNDDYGREIARIAFAHSRKADLKRELALTKSKVRELTRKLEEAGWELQRLLDAASKRAVERGLDALAGLPAGRIPLISEGIQLGVPIAGLSENGFPPGGLAPRGKRGKRKKEKDANGEKGGEA